MNDETVSAVSEDDLHALVDGQLEAARVPAVFAWLQAHPEDAARVAHWQSQRLTLRQLARGLDVGETPAALSTEVLRAAGRTQRRQWGLQATAAAVLLGVGLFAGRWWGLRGGDTTPLTARTNPPAFVRDATRAHAVFVPEKRHPVEVVAAEEAHLVQWLSKRLGAPLKVPSLAQQGWRLLGGRLLPGEGAPRAQFMYEDAQGQRLTLYVTVFTGKDAPAPTSFRSTHDSSGDAFYWIDERFGYALIAPAGASGLQALAQVIYTQLEP